MMKDVTSASLPVSLMLLALAIPGAVERPQTFSADLVTIQAGGEPSRQLGRIYVSDGQVRIETPELKDGYFLVDSHRSTAWFVRPAPRLFMDAKQSSSLTQVFVPVDPNNACGQWRVTAQVAGATDGNVDWHCDRIGPELVEGRPTLKYLASSRRDQRRYRWVDPQRRFPIRMETDNRSIVTLEQIVDALQPESLFVVPSDYYKFDPLHLIEMIKRSDVWVEPPR
jgi:hypothetical protein